MKAQGAGVREIARRLGRAPSTISRELRRNAATRAGKLEYRASVAQWKAELVAQRPKAAKLVTNEPLRDYVQERLAGSGPPPGRDAGCRSRDRTVEGQRQAAPQGSPLGERLEPRADREPAQGRFPR